MRLNEKNRVRWTWFLVIIGVHIAFLFLWPKAATRYEKRPALTELVIQLLLQPTPAPRFKLPSLVETSRQIKPILTIDPKNKPSQKEIAELSASQNISTPTIDESLANTPITSMTNPAISSENKLNLDVRKISKDLLAEQRPTQFPARPAASSFIAFANNVAAAARPRDITAQNFVMPDGTRITKMITPSGTYCVIAANAAGGGTIIAREVSRVVNCGNL